jgi:hypothetical protein
LFWKNVYSTEENNLKGRFSRTFGNKMKEKSAPACIMAEKKSNYQSRKSTPVFSMAKHQHLSVAWQKIRIRLIWDIQWTH